MSAQRGVHRKPFRLTLTVAGATVAASVVMASGIGLVVRGDLATHAPSGLASAQFPSARRSGDRAPARVLTHSAPPSQVQTAQFLIDFQKAHVLAVQFSQAAAREAVRAEAARKLAAQRAAARRAAQRAAARRAARRAAARRAARRAAARRAARRAAARQVSQSSPSQAAAPSGTPQQIALAMLGSFGWSSGQFGCLQSLWNRESGWNTYASNPGSGAYGIPQALPGSKMASAGPDWQTNPATQIRWGLGYIQQTYGSPCSAWSHEESYGWY